MLDLEWESCICCASALSSCLRSCLPHLTMVLLWIKEYQVSYRPDCCPKSGSPGGPPLFSITVAVVLTASAVQSHYILVCEPVGVLLTWEGGFQGAVLLL